MQRPTKIYFDGGARPNPGAIEIAAVLRGEVHRRAEAEPGSSSHAEWRALLYALEVARDAGERNLVLLGDSRFVIDQAKGAAKCRDPELLRYLAAFRDRAAGFASLRIRHIKRSQNLAGIALDHRRRF